MFKKLWKLLKKEVGFLFLPPEVREEVFLSEEEIEKRKKS